MFDVYADFNCTIDIDKEGKIILPSITRIEKDEQLLFLYWYNENISELDETDLRIYNYKLLKQYLQIQKKRLENIENNELKENVQEQIDRIKKGFIAIKTVDNERGIIIPNRVREKFLIKEKLISISGKIDRGIPYIKVGR